MRIAILAGLLAATLSAPSAAVTSFDFQFDNTPDSTVAAPIVGTGTFTTPDTLGAGDHLLSSLSGFSFSFQFGSISFDEGDIVTPLGNVILRISQFGPMTVLNFGGSGGGPSNGSLDFVNGVNQLTFQANFGVLYVLSSDASPFFGTYGGEPSTAAIPEPASWALLIAGFGLAGAVQRRRRLHTA